MEDAESQTLLIILIGAGFCIGASMQYKHLDNSGSDSRNLIGQLQVSKRGRGILSALGT